MAGDKIYRPDGGYLPPIQFREHVLLEAPERGFENAERHLARIERKIMR